MLRLVGLTIQTSSANVNDIKMPIILWVLIQLCAFGCCAGFAWATALTLVSLEQPSLIYTQNDRVKGIADHIKKEFQETLKIMKKEGLVEDVMRQYLGR